MPQRLEEQVGLLLLREGLTIGLAESTTGGLMGHLLNNVPGSSKYFVGGVVAYANAPKRRILGVAEATLKEHGSVSAEAALAMARGARAALGTDLGLAETGIAGPTGGGGGKPIGMFYIALVGPEGFERVEERRWNDTDRVRNKSRTARAALRMVRDYLSSRTGGRKA